jgi:ABC-type bacteriocin/lantibiotic exporter with double-glycine peptidase domain
MLVSNNHVVIKKLYELVDNKTNIYKQNFSVVATGKKAISFTDVSFKYFNSEVEIFDDLNLNIEKNKHTIITGPNGSGKSTLLGLSAGLLFPQKGKIASYSNKFGYVGVTPLIISGTLRDNLVYGNSKNIPDKDLIAYLEKFQVFNESAGNNLDNVVNNKILSSGQLQKISFIRSLISDVDILLLDESTSNLDENSRMLIFDLLKKSEMTIINSTHNHQDFDYDNHLKIVIEDEKRLVIPS